MKLEDLALDLDLVADLRARLAERLPSLYDGWTGAQVNAAVKPHGIRTVQVKHDGTNKRGLSRADVVTELGDAADLPDFTALTNEPTHDEKED